MDTIFLHDLRVETIIGIYDWERETRQTVRIDLDMAADTRRAAETDDILDTLDYKHVSKRITAFVANSRFQLIESLAEAIAAILRGEEFGIAWVRVTVNKLDAVRGTSEVGVIIERGAR